MDDSGSSPRKPKRKRMRKKAAPSTVTTINEVKNELAENSEDHHREEGENQPESVGIKKQEGIQHQPCQDPAKRAEILAKRRERKKAKKEKIRAEKIEKRAEKRKNYREQRRARAVKRAAALQSDEKTIENAGQTPISWWKNKKDRRKAKAARSKKIHGQTQEGGQKRQMKKVKQEAGQHQTKPATPSSATKRKTPIRIKQEILA